MEQTVKLDTIAGAAAEQSALYCFAQEGGKQLGLKDLWQYRELLYFPLLARY